MLRRYGSTTLQYLAYNPGWLSLLWLCSFQALKIWFEWRIPIKEFWDKILSKLLKISLKWSSKIWFIGGRVCRPQNGWYWEISLDTALLTCNKAASRYPFLFCSNLTICWTQNIIHWRFWSCIVKISYIGHWFPKRAARAFKGCWNVGGAIGSG